MWGFIQSPNLNNSRKKQHLPLPRNCWPSSDNLLSSNYLNNLPETPNSELKRPLNRAGGLTSDRLFGDPDDSYDRDPRSPVSSKSNSLSVASLIPVKKLASQASGRTQAGGRSDKTQPEPNRIQAALKIAEQTFENDEMTNIQENLSKEAALLHMPRRRPGMHNSHSEPQIFHVPRDLNPEYGWKNKQSKHASAPRPKEHVFNRVFDATTSRRNAVASVDATRNRNANPLTGLHHSQPIHPSIYRERERLDSRSSPKSMCGGRDCQVTAARGPKRAMEVDKRFQMALQEQWEQELGQVNYLEAIQDRQLGQFFEFLQSSESGSLFEGAAHYIPSMMTNIESIESEQLRAAPTCDPGGGHELLAYQAHALRELLQTFANISRPVRASGVENKVTDCDRMYRPTFCRFLVDSKLCDYGDTRYHLAVRHYDALAIPTRRAETASATTYVAAQAHVAGSASIETCVGVVCNLFSMAKKPFDAVRTFFETEMVETQKIADALRDQSRDRQITAVRLAQMDQKSEDDQKEFMKIMGAPPQFYGGSLRDWNNGSKQWIKSGVAASEPDAIAERAEQSFALECYLNDMICEPSCLSASQAYGGLFKDLYNWYADEKRISWNGRQEVPTSHMSCAAFFRFCIDFSIFPQVCCANDVWTVWRQSECLVELKLMDPEAPMPIERFQKAFKTLSSMLEALRKIEKSQNQDMKEDVEEDEEGDSCEDNSPSETGAPTGATAVRRASSITQSTAARGSQHSTVESLRYGSVHGASFATGGVVNRHPQRKASEKTPKNIADKLEHTAKQEAEQTKTPMPGNRFASIFQVTAKTPKSGSDKVDNIAAQVNEKSSKPSADKGDSPTNQGGLQAPQMSNAKQRQPSVAQPSKESATNAAVPIPNGKGAQTLAAPSAVGSTAPPMIGRSLSKSFTMSDNSGQSSAAQPPLSRSVSKDNKDNKDTSQSGKKARGSTMPPEEPEEPTIRIRAGIELTWLNKEFSKMSSQERKLYDVLDALKDCCNDRFLCVRGLFTAVREKGDPVGTVDAKAMLRALQKLYIQHNLTESDCQSFFRILQPSTDTNDIETSELEKAVNRLIHKAMKDNPGHLRELHALGEQARRLDDEDVWIYRTDTGAEDKDPHVTIFGWQSFMESLLRISLSHLHKSGVGIQIASPAGVRLMYLITLLRYNFDTMLAARNKGVALLARDNTRSPESSQRESRNYANPDAPFGVREHVEAWGSRPKASPASAEQPHAKYVNCLTRLLNEKPDIFKPWFDSKGNPAQSSDDTTKSGETCSTCKRPRNCRGRGSLFCHTCSGIDDHPLEDLHLYPVLQRKRLSLNMRALEAIQQERDRLEAERKAKEEEEKKAADAAAETEIEQDQKKDKKEKKHRKPSKPPTER